jgi:hypothetical protein
MILIYMLACRSIGGSEGFVISDAILFHIEGSESVEVEGSYQKAHSGTTWLWATGGGECPYNTYEDQLPEGDGWEKSPDVQNTEEERCAAWISFFGGELYSEVWRKNINISISDLNSYEKVSRAQVTECVVSAEADMGYDLDSVEIELDTADLKINGDQGHITAKAGSKLMVDLILPLCLIER